MPHAAPLTHPPTYTLLDPQERLDRLRRGGSSDGGSHRESHGNDSGTGSGIDGDTFRSVGTLAEFVEAKLGA